MMICRSLVWTALLLVVAPKPGYADGFTTEALRCVEEAWPLGEGWKADAHVEFGLALADMDRCQAARGLQKSVLAERWSDIERRCDPCGSLEPDLVPACAARGGTDRLVATVSKAPPKDRANDRSLTATRAMAALLRRGDPDRAATLLDLLVDEVEAPERAHARKLADGLIALARVAPPTVWDGFGEEEPDPLHSARGGFLPTGSWLRLAARPGASRWRGAVLRLARVAASAPDASPDLHIFVAHLATLTGDKALARTATRAARAMEATLGRDMERLSHDASVATMALAMGDESPARTYLADFDQRVAKLPPIGSSGRSTFYAQAAAVAYRLGLYKRGEALAGKLFSHRYSMILDTWAAYAAIAMSRGDFAAGLAFAHAVAGTPPTVDQAYAFTRLLAGWRRHRTRADGRFLRQLEQALRSHAAVAENIAAVRLAEGWLELGYGEEARTLLNRAIEITPVKGTGMAWQASELGRAARALLRMGDERGARRALGAALKAIAAMGTPSGLPAALLRLEQVAREGSPWLHTRFVADFAKGRSAICARRK